MSTRGLLLLWLAMMMLIAPPLALAADECIPFTRAAEMVGLEACVTGKIIDVHVTKSGTAYLNFCRDYLDCDFSIVVFPHDLRKIGNVRFLQGREIRITGQVEERNGKAQIAWHDADQLVVAVGDAPPPKGGRASGQAPPGSPPSSSKQ